MKNIKKTRKTTTQKSDFAHYFELFWDSIISFRILVDRRKEIMENIEGYVEEIFRNINGDEKKEEYYFAILVPLTQMLQRKIYLNFHHPWPEASG
jgi:hypothetical protein